MTLTVNVSIPKGQGYGAKIVSIEQFDEAHGNREQAMSNPDFLGFVTDSDGGIGLATLEHASLQPGEDIDIAMWDSKSLMVVEIGLKDKADG